MMRLSNGERADEPPGPVSVRVAVGGSKRARYLAALYSRARIGPGEHVPRGVAFAAEILEKEGRIPVAEHDLSSGFASPGTPGMMGGLQ
jgi:hypothetical protein